MPREVLSPSQYHISVPPPLPCLLDHFRLEALLGKQIASCGYLQTFRGLRNTAKISLIFHCRQPALTCPSLFHVVTDRNWLGFMSIFPVPPPSLCLLFMLPAKRFAAPVFSNRHSSTQREGFCCPVSKEAVVCRSCVFPPQLTSDFNDVLSALSECSFVAVTCKAEQQILCRNNKEMHCLLTPENRSLCA